MATSRTLPIPVAAREAVSVHINGTQAGLENDRVADSESDEEEEVIAPMRKRLGVTKRGHHPLSRPERSSSYESEASYSDVDSN